MLQNSQSWMFSDVLSSPLLLCSLPSQQIFLQTFPCSLPDTASKVFIFGFILSTFSRIRTEYGEIRIISPYLVRMRENVDQNTSEYWHFSRSVTAKPCSYEKCEAYKLIQDSQKRWIKNWKQKTLLNYLYVHTLLHE